MEISASFFQAQVLKQPPRASSVVVEGTSIFTIRRVKGNKESSPRSTTCTLCVVQLVTQGAFSQNVVASNGALNEVPVPYYRHDKIWYNLSSMTTSVWRLV